MGLGFAEGDHHKEVGALQHLVRVRVRVRLRLMLMLMLMLRLRLSCSTCAMPLRVCCEKTWLGF